MREHFCLLNVNKLLNGTEYDFVLRMLTEECISIVANSPELGKIPFGVRDITALAKIGNLVAKKRNRGLFGKIRKGALVSESLKAFRELVGYAVEKLPSVKDTIRGVFREFFSMSNEELYELFTRLDEDIIRFSDGTVLSEYLPKLSREKAVLYEWRDCFLYCEVDEVGHLVFEFKDHQERITQCFGIILNNEFWSVCEPFYL